MIQDGFGDFRYKVQVINTDNMAENSLINSITESVGKRYIDFSVNINPLSVPDTVKRQFARAAELSGAYPDPDCRHLCSLLAEKYHINADQILCGNGADDLLYRLVFAVKPKRVVVIEPTYEEYDRVLDLVGCEIQHYTLKAENSFTLSEDVLSVLDENCDITFLCNPNNPTGQLADSELMMKLIKHCRDKHILLVVDECFMEFLPDWEKYSVKEIATQSDNIIVIDAFTKTYSLAGFRLGFCVSGNAELLENMRLYGADFAVSVPALLAGISALADKEYMQKTHEVISAERDWLFDKLKKLPLEVYPSKANYLLFKGKENIRRKLYANGIKVRDCSHFYGLGDEYCRVAIRTHDDNEKLVKTLEKIL